MRSTFSKLLSDFFTSEKAGGFLLIACAAISLIIANSGAGSNYLQFWHEPVGMNAGNIQLKRPVEFWVNEGLMSFFFLLVGLEIKRELYVGELSSPKNALFPVTAAIGGMIIPASIHFLLNGFTPTQSGFGIPMATDIAFALGVLSLLGSKVPLGLKIFLTAFAIIDDLGAIIIIAIFYTHELSLVYLAIALAIFLALFIFNKLKVKILAAYLIPAIAIWYCLLQSGVHATLSGLLLALVLPFGDGGEKTISYRVQHLLHKPVAFIILPLFALTNTAIIMDPDWHQQLVTKNSLGIMAGLLIGKPLGILLFTYLAVQLKICQIPRGISWKQITGASILGGIGFTMSIFITLLAFNDPITVTGSKVAILISSLLAGLLGYLYLKIIAPRNSNPS